MAFNADSSVTAQRIMETLDPNLVPRFGLLVSFLFAHPDAAPKLRGNGNIEIGSYDYLSRLAHKFVVSRAPKAPSPPSTIPNTMVEFILQHYFDVPQEELDRAVTLHKLSMGAENFVGEILERYIASIVECQNWVWCSGSIVKAVDFIQLNQDGTWVALQVKNRDNSENSSSSAIRTGTEIKK
ncbi:SinI family restriction endonuclease [Rhodobacterales bacterium HKCCA1065]|nr:SinI family restriction endonuclease [Rhodobacterales bacterium HKCCA1065]